MNPNQIASFIGLIIAIIIFVLVTLFICCYDLLQTMFDGSTHTVIPTFCYVIVYTFIALILRFSISALKEKNLINK
jgi:hypothetical protein